VLEVDQPLRDRFRSGPDGEDHRQARAVEPQPAKVEVRGRVLERAPQSRVADQERRVRLDAERDDLRPRQQDAHEDDRGRALRRNGNRADLAERDPAHELDRVDGALGRDAQAWQDQQPVGVPRVLDRRDRRDVDLAREQHAVELRRDTAHLIDVRLDAVEDRRHVHVGDAAEPDHREPRPRRTSHVTAARTTKPPHSTIASGETSTATSASEGPKAPPATNKAESTRTAAPTTPSAKTTQTSRGRFAAATGCGAVLARAPPRLTKTPTRRR
jgi:hypothetical protein